MKIEEMQEMANIIVETCKEKRMTYREAVLMLDLAKNCVYERMERAMGETEVGGYIRKFKL